MHTELDPLQKNILIYLAKKRPKTLDGLDFNMSAITINEQHLFDKIGPTLECTLGEVQTAVSALQNLGFITRDTQQKPQTATKQGKVVISATKPKIVIKITQSGIDLLQKQEEPDQAIEHQTMDP